MLPRDTKGWGGHGNYIVIGAETVADARRAVEIALEKTKRNAGEIYVSDAGHLEFAYSPRADQALGFAFDIPRGKAFGFVCGSPAAIGFVMADLAVKAADVDSGYEEGETIAVDELKFTVWHTPGHTEGGVVLLCGEYLFAGDTVFQGSMGRTDLEGGDDRKMEQSLRKFAKLPIPRETQLLPGHGDFSTMGQELDNNFYIRQALRNAKAE